MEQPDMAQASASRKTRERIMVIGPLAVVVGVPGIVIRQLGRVKVWSSQGLVASAKCEAAADEKGVT